MFYSVSNPIFHLFWTPVKEELEGMFTIKDMAARRLVLATKTTTNLGLLLGLLYRRWQHDGISWDEITIEKNRGGTYLVEIKAALICASNRLKINLDLKTTTKSKLEN